RLTKAQMQKGKTPYISSSSFNNGIDAYISEEPNFKKNFLTFACYGSIGKVFYHPYDAWVSDNCNVMYLKNYNLNEYIATFLISVIEKEKYRFSYGFTGKLQTLNKLKIKLPSKNNEPDFQFMESYIKSIIHNAGLKTERIINKCFNTLPLNNNKVTLQKAVWRNFELNDLFHIKGSKTTPLLDLEEYGEGKYPYVTTQATNNGVEGFYGYYTEEGNVLTVDSAVLGYCSYQPLEFSASDHVEKLIPKFSMNKYVALFLITIINLEQYRYNYGIKCSQTRMRKAHIKLPSKNGQPDFDFMEQFIKSLPYSSSL
ncbi:MAG: restriction endonuclease subunit S, partial [Planctomycetota bacterium]|nr:restriction endonuclease subunit S [Planctomycetota bacterium]